MAEQKLPRVTGHAHSVCAPHKTWLSILCPWNRPLLSNSPLSDHGSPSRPLWLRTQPVKTAATLGSFVRPSHSGGNTLRNFSVRCTSVARVSEELYACMQALA